MSGIDVCQGERETLRFNIALQLRLFHTLSAGTQKMIRDYMNALAEQETSLASSVSTFGSIRSAVSFALHCQEEQAELLCFQEDVQI